MEINGAVSMKLKQTRVEALVACLLLRALLGSTLQMRHQSEQTV